MHPPRRLCHDAVACKSTINAFPRCDSRVYPRCAFVVNGNVSRLRRGTSVDLFVVCLASAPCLEAPRILSGQQPRQIFAGPSVPLPTSSRVKASGLPRRTRHEIAAHFVDSTGFNACIRVGLFAARRLAPQLDLLSICRATVLAWRLTGSTSRDQKCN